LILHSELLRRRRFAADCLALALRSQATFARNSL
jgi:hypothetical protein